MPFGPSDDETIWEYLHRADLELWSAGTPAHPVLVIDQFEEVFTLGERVPELVRAFRDDLGDLVENRIPVEIAARDDDPNLALRSHEYKLAHLPARGLPAGARGLASAHPIARSLPGAALPLRTGAAVEAVRGPAADLMTTVLARRIVDFIAGENIDGSLPDTTAGPNRPTGGHPSDVEPALLSLFCRELNEERKRQGKARFDDELIEGAKSNVLSNYYTSCVRDLPEHVAHFIEFELISRSGFRNSYAREDAVPSHLSEGSSRS